MNYAQLVSVVLDVCIGGMAYRLARQTSAILTQVQVALEQLTSRVTQLEQTRRSP